MTQGQLHDLMILNAHKQRVGRLGLDKIAEDYVSNRQDRLRKFGLFL